MAHNRMNIIPLMISWAIVNIKRTCEPVEQKYILVSALMLAGLVVDSEILFWDEKNFINTSTNVHIE